MTAIDERTAEQRTAEQRTADYIRRLIDEAPVPTPAQAAQLAHLLRPRTR